MKPSFDHFDLASLARTLDSLRCARGHQAAGFIGLARSQNTGDIKYARLVCFACDEPIIVDGRPWMWMPTPKLPAKQKKQRPRITHLPVAGQAFCWICSWDVITLASFGMGIQYAHPIDRAAAIDAHRDPMDNETFPLCDYHHAWVDRERAQYARLLALYQAAGAVLLEPTGIERPILNYMKDEER